MIITIWCIAVVVISIVAVGVPLRWLLNSRRPLGILEWIEAPFLGIAAIVLVLQNLAYLDLSVRYTSVLVWILAGAGWAGMVRARQLSATLATAPKALFGTALAVYLLQGLGLLIVGAKYYVGRAWGDQYNYTVLAQFLVDQRFSTSMQEVGNRPYLANAIDLKWDRIGQSILHSFFAVSSLQDTKTLFEPTILLSPALIVLAMYALARRFGQPHLIALAVAAAAGMLPGIAAIHLESFLSQALAVPLLLIMPVLLDRLIAQLTWAQITSCALVVAAIASIYTELWIILLGLMLLMLGLTALGSSRAQRLIGCWCLLALAPFVLNPISAIGILTILLRVGEPVLGHLYPWAFAIEGIGRLWLGDLAAGGPQQLQSPMRAYALAVLAFGYYGLASTCTAKLSAVAGAWHAPEQRRELAFGVGVLALALLPVLVIARDDQHAYQFYKLLLSICPLLVLGLVLVFQPNLSVPAQAGSPAFPARLAERLALLAVGAVLVGGSAGTTMMALESTSLKPTSDRYNGYYLLAPELHEAQERLEALHNTNLFFYQTDSTWSTGFLNAWLAYFARDNQIWLGNPQLNGLDLGAEPETRQIINWDSIPDDVLVLSNMNAQLAALLPTHTLLWSNTVYQLWKPAGPYWLVPLKLENKYGLEQLGGEPFFWMGQEDTSIQLIASRSGIASLNASFILGPAEPDRPTRTLLVSNGAGYSQRLLLTSGARDILLPVRAGPNTITLRVLEPPTNPRYSNGDPRLLMLGVQRLQLAMSQTAVVIGAIDNPNGLERLGDQPFFWVGQADTKISVLASEAGTLQMNATFSLGPSAPDRPTRRVLVATDHGSQQTVILANGLQSISIPVEAGINTITLRGLDQPAAAKPSSGDTRTLLLGVQGLQVALQR
jgi:hypothetical protein